MIFEHTGVLCSKQGWTNQRCIQPCQVRLASLIAVTCDASVTTDRKTKSTKWMLIRTCSPYWVTALRRSLVFMFLGARKRALSQTVFDAGRTMPDEVSLN